ncbi:MAG TPA: T9SS type A sorting domain-containing protein [Sphingobacteriaceae bacterium]|nr:T9SS type A sorting domain-containing protein [Sphingobacteriaceae bacterium]
MKYKIAGTQQWYNGLSLISNSRSGAYANGDLFTIEQYRGSLVNLTPNTQYEVKLTLDGTSQSVTLTGVQVKTLNENFVGAPASDWTVPTVNYSTPLNIPPTASGTSTSYKVYDGNNKIMNLAKNHDNGITIDADYIIIRNFIIQGARLNGILVKGLHKNIIIENCDISAWGIKDNDESATSLFGEIDLAGIKVDNGWVGPGSGQIIIQRNKIHHPSWDTNNWNEDRLINTDNHPEGPVPIFFQNSKGNNIIRYNEIWSDQDHFFNDGIGGKRGATNSGNTGADTDIYGNYVSYCHDDGISIEGGVQNVRVWENFVENTYQGIANAPVSIGPLYMWRNVFGGGTTVAGGGKAASNGVKMGESGGIEMMVGYQYIFNNTYTQLNDTGWGNLGSARLIRRTTTRNNILHTRSGINQTIGVSKDGVDRGNGLTSSKNDFDYDLISNPEIHADGTRSFPEKEGVASFESNGIKGTVPGYVSGTWYLSTKTANFKLLSTSAGHDGGEIINNFSDKYNLTAPDIGAHEKSYRDVIYGVNSNFAPDQLAANPITFTSATTKTYEDAPFALAATATSGGTVTYSLVSGPGSLSGSTLTITGTGTIVVRASVDANGTYASNEQDQSITVAKASQTITFNTLANKVYYTGVPTFTVSATASSGLAPTYSIVSGPASISGNTITLTGAGTVTVRAIQGGNENYNAATNVDQSFMVTTALQAENATLNLATVESSATGYTGTGYVNFSPTSGSSVTFTVSLTSSATLYFAFRYANGSTAARTANLLIDNTAVTGGVTFNVTGSPASFSAWTMTNTFSKSLASGTHTIKIVTTGSDAGNVDYMTYSTSPSFAPVAVVTGKDQLKLVNLDENFKSFTASVSPNPASREVRLFITHPQEGDLNITFTNMSGQVVKTTRQQGMGSSSELFIPINDLSPGLYMIKVIQGGEVAQTKLFVQ